MSIIGNRYGKLIVLAIGPKKTAQGGFMIEVQCDCGSPAKFVRKGDLSSGDTNSCGCLQRDLSSRRSTKHGLVKHPLFHTWQGMMMRCYYPKNKAFHLYGGRGIFVCERWHNVANFVTDIGDKPTPTHTLDRIDVNGPYGPDNCRWATPVEQGSNRRNNVILTANGESLTLAAWAKKLHMPPGAIRTRLKRGWTVEQSINIPVDPSNKIASIVEWNGIRASLQEHARPFGVTGAIVHTRIRSGWSIDRAITEPVAHRKPRKNKD